MSFLLKDPAAVLDYTADWGADYLNGDALAESHWAIVPAEPGGARVDASQFDGMVASVTVSGGEAGKVYRLSNHVLTASGRIDSRSFTLRVEKR